MSLFFLYFFSYILTLSGFLLGKSTKEEHKEIKKYILNYYTKIILSIFYIISIGLFYNQIMISFLIGLIFILHISFWTKKNLLALFNIISLSILFLIYYYLKIDYLSLILILIGVILIINSFKKFKLKEILYEISIYIILYVILNAILK